MIGNARYIASLVLLFGSISYAHGKILQGGNTRAVVTIYNPQSPRIPDCPVRIGFVDNSFHRNKDNHRIFLGLDNFISSYFPLWFRAEEYDWSISSRGRWEMDVVDKDDYQIYHPMGVDLVFDITEKDDGFEDKVSISVFKWIVRLNQVTRVSLGKAYRWSGDVGYYSLAPLSNGGVVAVEDVKNIRNDPGLIEYMEGLVRRCGPVIHPAH